MDKPAEQGKNKVGLVRQLGLFDSTMILVGIVIGSGIFLRCLRQEVNMSI
jgi:APA family basic amino acid/polyamine antiporter